MKELRLPALLCSLLLLAAPSARALDARSATTVPAPFEPLRVSEVPEAVDVELWGRSYRFQTGPLPSAVRSQGVSLFVAAPRFRLGVGTRASDVVWQPPAVLERRPDVVRLRSVGAAPGLRFEAETQVEYDGMIAVSLVLHAERAVRVDRLAYELALEPQMRFFSRHLPYDYRVANVDKKRMLESAGELPARLSSAFAPTLALGGRDVGVEWWSETNAHWRPRAGQPIEVVREADAVRLRITPIGAVLPLPPSGSWRDSFALFVFPSRPPPERWRSVRITPYTRVSGFDSRIGTRFVYLATQATYHARHDGLPASVDDEVQRELRATLTKRGVGYMPYGMLTVAPYLHPRTMASFDEWSADGKWLRLQEGYDNPVIRRTHPELKPGAPYGYPVCAARKDYFDWIVEENVATVRNENLDALYFDHGAITRMCTRNPGLRGRPDAQSWEYGNIRAFYKRLYEQVKATNPETLIMAHTHGAPKAIAAFLDFHIFGEALNGVFGGGRPASDYFANPSHYTPDYLALPRSYLDAHLFPRVGGVASILPQIKWAIDPGNPGRVRGFQRALQALALSNDAHVVLGVSDMDTADEIYRAVDRFGDISNARVHPWWSNGGQIRRAEPLRVTAWVREGKALLVLANLANERWSGRIQLDLEALSVPHAGRVRNLERPARRAEALEAKGFEATVPPRDLRVMLVE